ncbi:hypothetical protein F4803DRAFT_574014 [Xylaria telfairii]|nr:hypothetical protein F4803DRAFT_574014 [Xylaria telfairii]
MVVPFSSPTHSNLEGDKKDGTEEMRWPLKRGGYAIEKRCSECRYWFDSFDPQRTKCRLCFDPKKDNQPPPANASIPKPTVQQSKVPQASPNPLPLSEVRPVENTQLDYTQCQQYGQGYISSPDLSFSTGMMSSLPGGYNMPNQMWGQGYDTSLNPSGFAGVMSDPMGSFTQIYGGGYSMSPDLSLSPGTMSNSLGMYTPVQQWAQQSAMPLDTYNSFGTLPCTTGGYMPNQAYQQGNESSFNVPPQTLYQETSNEGVQPKMTKTPVPKSNPFRPLRPRDKNAPPPPEVEDDDEYDDGNDESQEVTPHNTWLNSQAYYTNTMKKHGGSNKKKGSSSKNKQSSRCHKQKK